MVGTVEWPFFKESALLYVYVKISKFTSDNQDSEMLGLIKTSLQNLTSQGSLTKWIIVTSQGSLTK